MDPVHVKSSHNMFDRGDGCVALAQAGGVFCGLHVFHLGGDGASAGNITEDYSASRRQGLHDETGFDPGMQAAPTQHHTAFQSALKRAVSLPAF